MQFFVVAAILTCSLAFHDPVIRPSNFERDWKLWKKAFNKRYSSPVEEVKRKAIFSTRWDYMQYHKKSNLSFTLGFNEHSDKDHYELTSKPNLGPGGEFRAYSGDIPDKWDWRQKCALVVHNQGMMGDSLAFDIADAAAIKCCKDTGKISELSPQQVIDCCLVDGRLPVKNVYGCLKTHGGMCSEASYPTSKPGQCHSCKAVCSVDSTGYVPRGNEDVLKAAVWNTSAVVAVDASRTSFQMYRAGIYEDAECSKDSLDHAMVAVGYGMENGKDFWILKNSWGASWGEQGYMRLLRGKNMCGVAEAAFGPL